MLEVSASNKSTKNRGEKMKNSKRDDTTKYAVEQYNSTTDKWTWLAVYVDKKTASTIAKRINEDANNPHICARLILIED